MGYAKQTSINKKSGATNTAINQSNKSKQMYTKLSKQIQVFTDGKPQIVTITVNYSRTNIELISITVYQEWKHSNMAATETDITHMVEEFGCADTFINKVNWSEVYANRKEKELINQ